MTWFANNIRILVVIAAFSALVSVAQADTFFFKYYPQPMEWLDQYSQIGTAIRALMADMNDNLGVLSGDNTWTGTNTFATIEVTFADIDTAEIDALNVDALNVEINDESVEVDVISGATYDDLNDYLNCIQSAGAISGGTITDDGDGTITVAPGTGIIKSTDDDLGENFFFDWDTAAVSLTDDSINWIYITYNGGSPEATAETSINNINHHDEFVIGRVYRDGTELHILNVGSYYSNFFHRVCYWGFEVEGFEHATGAVTSETGTRNIAITSGVWYCAMNRFTTNSFDSSGADTFNYWYRDGVGGWTQVTGETQIDNLHYDDGSGTLATLGNTRYGIHWVYMANDGNVDVVYGQGSYRIGQARDANPPSALPGLLTNMSFLVAKIIIQKNDATFTSIETPWATPFTVSVVEEHNDLGGLQGGTTDEYYHLSSSDYNELTDGGATTVHIHGHGDLDGLGDDDHPQYGALSQNETVTGTWAFEAGTTAEANISLTDTAEIRFVDSDGDHVGFEVGDVTASQIWVLPTADGAADEYLKTDGSGNLSWDAPSGGGGGGSPAGANGDIQFYDDGDFGADTGDFYYDTAETELNSPLINVPTTTSTEGQYMIGGSQIIHTYGTENAFFGGSGNFTLSGADKNGGFGKECLVALTSGDYNWAGGYRSLYKVNSGSYNVAGGRECLYNVSSGTNNLAFGTQAGYSLTTESYNILLGTSTGLYLRGTGNSMIGYNCGLGTSGSTQEDRNTAFGYQCMQGIAGGDENCGGGYQSLYNLTTGYYNVAWGPRTLRTTTTGHENTAFGTGALRAGAAGGYLQTAVGYQAGYSATGNYSTFAGAKAGYSCTGSKCLCLGYEAGKNETNSNRLHIAYDDATTLIYGEFDNGYVGINQQAATCTLDVKADESAGNVARFWNDGNNADRYGIIIQNGTDDNSGTNYHIAFRDGDGDNVGLISSSGGTVTYGTFTGFHECFLPEGTHPEYGNLLIILRATTKSNRPRQPEYLCGISTRPKDKRVFGVYFGEHSEKMQPRGGRVLVAALGDGHIRVCGEGGNIEAGDYLQSSSVPGCAMKQADDLLHNYTVAKATAAHEFKRSDEVMLIPCTYHAQ